MFQFLSARNDRRSHPGHERGRARVAFAAELTFADVSKRYGESLALDHVSLAVPPGKVLCLLGPSGCGKTTLLRIAAGVERPTSGRVLLETGWIKLRGRRRAPGRPVTYGTTEQFLGHFGFDSIQDLPGLSELKGAGLLDSNLPPGFAMPNPDDAPALREDEDPLEDEPLGDDEEGLSSDD